jgi:hypothetical protein
MVHIIPLAKWDEAKRQPSSSEDAGVMYYYPVAGLFLIPEGPWLFYAPDLVRLRTPSILEQYLMSSPETSPPSAPLVVRSTRRSEHIIESYPENILEKYRFSLDRSCAGQHKCLIVVNQNELSRPLYSDSSYRGFNFIYLTTLRSSTYFTKNPSLLLTTKKLYDASDVWSSKYHVDCITQRIAKLKMYILYCNVYSRLLRIADAKANRTREGAAGLGHRAAVLGHSSPCCDTKNLLSALPREILSKIAWMTVKRG